MPSTQPIPTPELLDPGRLLTDDRDDLTVTEALVPGDLEEELYFVFAGDAYDQDVPIGIATGTASFDLAGSGVRTTRWLRIVSRSLQDPNAPLAGLELDGVTILHSIGSKSFSAFCAGDGLDPQVTTPCRIMGSSSVLSAIHES